MKKLLPLLVMVAFIAGCGGGSTAKKEETQQKSSDENIVQGFEYLEKQNIAQAIQSFDAAIKEDPTNSENYLVLGQVYMRLKQYNRAIDTFAAATRVDPSNGEIFYLLAYNKMLDGRKEGAVKDARRSVELFMQNREEDKFKKAVALLKGLESVPGAIPQEIQ